MSQMMSIHSNDIRSNVANPCSNPVKQVRNKWQKSVFHDDVVLCSTPESKLIRCHDTIRLDFNEAQQESQKCCNSVCN